MGNMRESAFAKRFEQIKSTRQDIINPTDRVVNDYTVTVDQLKISLDSELLRPSAPTWEQVVEVVSPLINAPGYLETRIKKLFDDGYGAELLTAAENARNLFRQSPLQLFMKSTSAKSGNWEERTVPLVKKTWQARKNMLDVMSKLNIDPKLAKYILKRAWALGDRIRLYLGAALEKSVGIKNPIAIFMWLISEKRKLPTT